MDVNDGSFCVFNFIKIVDANGHGNFEYAVQWFILHDALKI